ncbi:MAG: FAD-dependent oxidoreductase [Thioclava marina]|uniref:NAD(P)/FAD-dependent oxidoreductase n=1 Tax=Thioclava marina TaxID=1915077 RepID=UPI001994FC49|nr:FAD-dependent oxidoreductase [Thioclava marina]MBC7143913.1 FAD-dependent oxidoreductase [Thioclava marina]
MENVVILGAGQAGAAAALKLRDLGFEGKITLVGDEAYPPYERPELSKGYALGRTSFDALTILTAEDAVERQIDLRLVTQGMRIDREAKQVETSVGTIPYDALIFATGGTARRLPLPRKLRARTFAIRTRDDADALREKLPLSRSVVVIGGGWLGTEVAITARSLCPEVHLIEAAGYLCARVAPRWLSERLAECQSEANVNLHLGQLPTFSEDGAIAIGDAVLMPDMIIEAIGMRANDDLAKRAGLACADGILVDTNGQTSDPAIFAIGDCARAKEGEQMRKESWQHANHSAEDVARFLMGAAKRAPEADWFWSTQGKHKIQMVGTCDDAAEQWERRGPRGCSRLYLKGARLIGCISMDNPRETAEARRIIAAKQSLDQTKAADGAIPLSKCIADARETLRLPH